MKHSGYIQQTPRSAKYRYEYSVDAGETWEKTTSTQTRQTLGWSKESMERLQGGEVVRSKEGKLFRAIAR